MSLLTIQEGLVPFLLTRDSHLQGKTCGRSKNYRFFCSWQEVGVLDSFFHTELFPPSLSYRVPVIVATDVSIERLAGKCHTSKTLASILLYAVCMFHWVR